MNPSPLPERDRRGNEDAFNHSQRGSASSKIDRAVITALGIAGAVSLTTEWVIGYRVFSGLFAPDIPGEDAHGPAVVMAFSTALAATAFHVYLLEHGDAFAGRLLRRSVPWLVLGFIGSMALMATRSVLDAAGLSFFGGVTPSPDLFADTEVVPGASLFDRVVIGAFSVGLASLAVANFWLTQRIADLLCSKLKPMIERRSLAQETKSLMTAINEDEARLARLGAERQALAHELEPERSFAFATELAALIQALRGPVAGVVTSDHIWKKKSPSVVERKDEPELEIGKLKELAAPLDLTPEKIFSAFGGHHEVKKK